MYEDERRKNVRKPRSILSRIRGGRGYGSGSGSVIWESAKRQEARLKTPQIGPQFSTFIRPEVRTAKCRISKRDEREALSTKQHLFPAGRFSITSCGKKVTTCLVERSRSPHTCSEYVFNILLRCFRPLYSFPVSPKNPALQSLTALIHEFVLCH